MSALSIHCMKHGNVVPSSEKPVMRNKKLGHGLYVCIWIMHESGFDMSRFSRTLGVSAVPSKFTGRQLQYRLRWSLPVYVEFFLKAGVPVRHPHAFPAAPFITLPTVGSAWMFAQLPVSRQQASQFWASSFQPPGEKKIILLQHRTFCIIKYGDMHVFTN